MKRIIKKEMKNKLVFSIPWQPYMAALQCHAIWAKTLIKWHPDNWIEVADSP